MFCVFQELSSCACKSWFCSMVENLSATTSFITFIKLLLRVRSIAWYIAQLCPLTVGQSSVPALQLHEDAWPSAHHLFGQWERN